tara:strand:- start:1586 stop:1987 length:402 start_codon:yes stop_codon:yes gene_type:complete
MIILHNHLSKESREFVAANGTGNIVLSWYEGGREQFESIGGHKKISAFPSVIIHVPTHNVTHYEEDNIAVKDTILRQAAHMVVRDPVSMSDVDKEIDNINIVLSKSGDHGVTVAQLNRQSALHRSDTWWKSQL